jgi:outer membrane receptor protein involved in Fe transport
MREISYRQRLLLAATVLISSGESGLALAQTADTGQSHGQAIEEVVVTATRRTEKLERVPISVSAFSDAKMDVLGVKNFSQLAKFTPGVTYDPDTNNIYIRGIDSTAGSGTTGIYIDDTPIQLRNLGFSSNNTLPSVFDLDRVEVLRGPQGTLFGAGSEGGTVRYIMAQPSLTDYTGLARSEVEFTQDGQPSYEDGAAFGGPIVDNELGFRVSGWYRRDGGWIDQVNYRTGLTTIPDANSTDTYVARGALTWAPISRLTITPSIDYQNRDNGDPDQYWVGLSNPDDGDYKVATPDRQIDKDRWYLASLNIHYAGDAAELISNTSMFGRGEHVNGYSGTLYNLSYFQQILINNNYQFGSDPEGDNCAPGQCKINLYPLLTPDGINLPGLPDYIAHTNITNTQHDVTEELRLQSTDPNSRLTWVIGVFYAGNDQESKEEINDPELPQITKYLWNETLLQAWGENLLPNGDDYINDTLAHDSQVAAFADATYALTDQWKLEAGLRYAHTQFDFTNYANGPQNFGPSSGNGGERENPVTPKVSVDFQVTPDDLIYGTIAEGYRIGGANPPFPLAACGVPSVPSSYTSDSTWSYEVGAKDKWLGGKLQTDASVYYVDWNGIQQDVYLPLCGLQYTSNLGDAVSKGFDFQADYQVTGSLHLETSVGYTDARYSTFAYSADGTLLSAPGQAIGSQPYISPWTLTVGAEYDFEMYGNESYARLDDEFASQNNWPLTTQNPASESYDPHLVSDPATNTLGARAGMTFESWDVALFVNNLLDSHPRLDLNHQDSNTVLYEASTLRPRTGGIEVNYRF